MPPLCLKALSMPPRVRKDAGQFEISRKTTREVSSPCEPLDAGILGCLDECSLPSAVRTVLDVIVTTINR